MSPNQEQAILAQHGVRVLEGRADLSGIALMSAREPEQVREYARHSIVRNLVEKLVDILTFVSDVRLNQDREVVTATVIPLTHEQLHRVMWDAYNLGRRERR